MRRILILCILGCLVLNLAGCSFGSQLKEPVPFYYTRDGENYVYGEADGVITSEEREASGHTADLEYLLSLYLSGPLDEDLVSPFPEGTQLESIDRDSSGLIILLNDSFSQLSGMELTVACACISATCFALVDVQQVRIISPQTQYDSAVEMVITRDTLTLIDTVMDTGAE